MKKAAVLVESYELAAVERALKMTGAPVEIHMMGWSGRFYLLFFPLLYIRYAERALEDMCILIVDT